jgi:hypothetical protein
MDYNTFTNEVDEPIILVDIEDYNDKQCDNDKQCLICLEKVPINDKDHITLINEMHFLIKKCKCLCYAHHTCIEKWICINAVCPICKGEISFPVMDNKKTEFIVALPSSYILDSNSVQNNIGTAKVCIRTIFFGLFAVIVFQIIIPYLM